MKIKVNVYPLLSDHIGIVVKTYTFCDENVYVSVTGRIPILEKGMDVLRRSGWRRKSKEKTGKCKIQIEMLVYLDGNRYICTYALCISDLQMH